MSLLQIDNVTAGYQEGIAILNDLTLAAEPTSVTIIIGPNGAGKSTLLKTIYGFLKPRLGQMTFDGRAMSILEVPGARDVAIELHSCSKTFSMTGWRVGWACGNKDLVAGLGRMKSNVDSGIFTAVQNAATVALQHYDEIVPPLMKMYHQRRDVFCNGLKKIGWNVQPPEGTFYCWIPVPKGHTSAETCTRLLDEADIVTTPGNGFGAPGEGFVRATLTVTEERLAQTVDRIAKLKW